MQGGAGPIGGRDNRSEPRVAVVVPCYNDGRYLHEALASLAGQEPDELVVVDDGSHDVATLEVLEGLRSEGTRVISQPNAGLGSARMTGVRATRAPYVHPLDADDQLAPDALGTLADALDAHPDAAAAWGSYQTFGSTDCFFPTAPRLDPWRITYFDEIPGTVMMRRDAIEAVGGWERVPYEDWDLWMRLAASGRTGVGVPVTTLYYREHETPRLLSDTMLDFNRHYRTLRERHSDLFRARRENRRRSPAPVGLKLLLPLIEALPGLSDLRKWQLWAAARYMIEPHMASDCYRGPSKRLRELVSRGSESPGRRL